MRMTKLMTGVASVALLGGVAHAQDASVAGDFSGDKVIASEYTGEIAGDLIINFDDLAGAFDAMGAGGAVTVEVSLVNATFSSTVPNDAWSAAADANCDFGEPSLGGGSGGSSVQFENTGQLNLCGATSADLGNNGVLTLPIEVTSNGDPVSVEISFTPTADAGSYTGADIDLDLLTFAQYLSFVVDFDATATPPQGQFDSDGDALQGSGQIGLIETVKNDSGTGAVTHVDLTTTDSGADDVIDEADIIITFPEGAEGIGGVTLDGDACTQGTAPNDNVFTCDGVAGGDVDGFDGSANGVIEITDDGDSDTFITVQTPTVAIEFTAQTDYDLDDVAATDVAPLELDDGLGEETITGSAFPWTRIGAGGTESRFRVALGAADDASDITEVRVTCGASNSGGPFGDAGVITLLPSPGNSDPDQGFRTSGNVLSFTSAGLGAAGGGSGNCDITGVELQYDEDELTGADITGADIQRLLLNASSVGLSDL